MPDKVIKHSTTACGGASGDTKLTFIIFLLSIYPSHAHILHTLKKNTALLSLTKGGFMFRYQDRNFGMTKFPQPAIAFLAFSAANSFAFTIDSLETLA